MKTPPSSSTFLLKAASQPNLQKRSFTHGLLQEAEVESIRISMCMFRLESADCREGKVCLSLLGTWHSQNDTKSWNPKQSTLLQLFLSIQSLVLTARPYYNEAGFTTHMGLDEASVGERLYSERAYFLSRGFVKYALENAIEGLEQEVRYLFTDDDGPQLARSVIEDGNKVIAKSEVAGDDDGEWERGRVTRVSRGGLEVLRRTIAALERLVPDKSTTT